MNICYRHYWRSPLIACLLCLALGACTQAPQPLAGGNGAAVDFSGHWEMDYSDSDDIQGEINVMVRELRRQAERRSQGRMDGRSGPGVAVAGGGTNSGPSIIGLAQMADMITQSQLLEIEQAQHEITVKRENNFALNCEFYEGKFQVQENPLGSEACGWDSRQMVFRVYLPEGLTIAHRMTLGPTGQRLNIATTVLSDRVTYPFTLNRVYNRYDPAAQGFRCEMTLTRGRVCTTEAAP